MKSILVFYANGELYSQINYRSHSEAKKQLKIFKKMGIVDFITGNVIPECKFELI